MADATTLARPYAKAVFQVAAKAGNLSSWASTLSVAGAAAEDDTVLRMIADPNVDNATLMPVFQGKEDTPNGYDNFLKLLVENGRLPVLPEIARLFEELRADAERTLKVIVRSATELSDEYKARLASTLAQKYGREVDLNAVVDENMIGGAVIQAGDLVIDGSLRRRLNLLSEALK